MVFPSEPSPEEARELLNGPPQYDEAVPATEFDVDDQIEAEDGDSGEQQTLLGSVRRFGKNGITIPVKHVIDPIVSFFQRLSLMFDSFVSRWANPYIARRLIFVIGVGALIGTLYFTFIIKIPPKEGHKDHARLRSNLKMSLSAQRLRDNSEYFGEMPHFAGSLAGHTTAEYVMEYFESLGLKSVLDRHDVYLSHGDFNLLELMQSDGSVVYSSNLQEPQQINNVSQPLTQMALVRPGDAAGPLVYANFGSEEDLNRVDVSNKMVLVKYGLTDGLLRESCGVVANRLQSRGALGVLFMSAKSENELSWPEGADYDESSIQQGSIGDPYRFPGDLLSPGWPSSMEQVLDRPKAYSAGIPVAAISWKDAKPLLESLQGHGAEVPEWSNNGMPSEVTEWWTGPSPETKVHLNTSPVEESRHQITNVIGEIRGRETSNRVVFIGARLDAMCFGSTQLSGLTVMLEVARALAELQYSQQWTPLRSVHFVVWDGTSHNFAGSTEWVESVAEHLQAEGIAYIDLDGGISGGELLVQGNPLIEIAELLDMVSLQEDGQTKKLTEILSPVSFRPIPDFGNHIAFESHTGVPTIKLGFHNVTRPVPVDSCLDNIAWMQKFGDPDYARHYALAELTSYLALELADAPLVPFSFEQMTSRLRDYVAFTGQWANSVFRDAKGEVNGAIRRLLDAVGTLETPAKSCGQMRREWEEFANINMDSSTGIVTEPIQVERTRFYWNEKLMQANGMALDRNGISVKRNWYKNHLFGPAADVQRTDALAGVFPGMQDALHQHDLATFVAAAEDAASHIVNIAVYLDEFGF